MERIRSHRGFLNTRPMRYYFIVQQAHMKQNRRRHVKTNNAVSCNSSKAACLLKIPQCFSPPRLVGKAPWGRPRHSLPRTGAGPAPGPGCVTRHHEDAAFPLVLLRQVGNDGEVPVLGGKQRVPREGAAEVGAPLDPVIRPRPAARRCHQPWNRARERTTRGPAAHRPQGGGAARAKQSRVLKAAEPQWVLRSRGHHGKLGAAAGQAGDSTARLAGRLGGVRAEMGRSTAGRRRGRSPCDAKGKPGKPGRGGGGGACGRLASRSHHIKAGTHTGHTEEGTDFHVRREAQDRICI